ncbi:uncharacterized protein LOC135816092 [Sycon ciliatum]|uniref:uncharacterized protein LOC135816092 n=1 Tax=Sycon ciliatum TaxID=27933 RepID=UPI0020ABC524|eukprot:scpid48355/ scgid31084/ Probable E3 ubiquitin-protein ligase HERC1; HECT domain and RCC1-like domain-containing protein 1; p532; p619
MSARQGPSIQMKKELASEDPAVLALAELVNGATLLKAVRNGKPHFRDFSISKDLTKLTWNSANKKDAGVLISEILEIRHGQKTKIFKDNPVPEYEGVSFSVMMERRSLDIVCKDQREYEAWTRGLEALLGGYKDVDAVMSVYNKHQRVSQLKVAYDSHGQAKIAVQEDKCDVYTWGKGYHGILGHGEEDDERSPRVLEAILGRGIKQLVLADKHSIALESSGDVYSWGNGQFGKLGHNNLHPRFLPLRVAALSFDVCHVSIAAFHSAAVLENGSVYTWGQALASDPDIGRLGYSCTRRSTVPKKVDALKDHCAVMVACGHDHTMVLTEDFYVVTFGDNRQGQLGTGEGVNESFSTQLYFGDDVEIEKVTAGNHHSAALSSDGDLFLWGSNQQGQCAMGEKGTVWTPQRVPLPEKVEDVACGEFHTLVATEGGALFACGANSEGQLGMGVAAKKTKYTAMTPLTCNSAKFVKVAAGALSSAAVTDAGRLYTWGNGEHGILGQADTKPRFSPTEVAGLGDKMVRSVAIGCNHMGALTLNTWVGDDETKLCMSCKLKFTTVRRRHHCRQCGGVFCSNCTTKRFPLLDKGFSDPVRVCDRCYALLTRKAAAH